VVLPRVVAGKLKPQEVSTEVSQIGQEFNAACSALFPNHKVGLQALREFEAKYPALANNPIILRAKLSLLPKVGEVEESKKVAETVVAKAIKHENSSALLQVAALLRNGPGKESKELLAMAVKAAEAAVRSAGDNDAGALLDLADTYFQVGDRAKAREYARKAVKASAGEPLARKKAIEEEARKLEADDRKKEDRK
jgi:tetratricopeptide (TPR) repeat protein